VSCQRPLYHERLSLWAADAGQRGGVNHESVFFNDPKKIFGRVGW